MKLLTFAVFLLAATVSLQAQGSTAPPNLDHFNCYLATGTVQPQFALLQDQFDARDQKREVIQDLRLAMFCNPVQKQVISSANIPPVPIQHPDAHLAMYLIPPEPVVPRSVTVINQFGTQKLTTGRAQLLAVPSGKAHIASTVPATLPAIPDPKDLDHFKCYGATGQAINSLVVLKDQFFTTGLHTKVLEPVFFCNPVQKTTVTAGNPNASGAPAQVSATTTPILNPAGHLTCYTEVPTSFQTVVMYNNQFVPPGTLPTVQLRNAEVLCVPSLKNENWTPITVGGIPPIGN